MMSTIMHSLSLLSGLVLVIVVHFYTLFILGFLFKVLILGMVVFADVMFLVI